MLQALIEKLKPLIKWIGKVHVPFSRKKITGKHYYLMRDMISPGCIFLTKTYGEMTNLINPGEMKHAAIYSGGEIIKWVTEAVGAGVVSTDLVTFLTSKDEVIILDPLGEIREKRSQVAEFAATNIGLGYDFSFSFANKSKYCAELIYDCVKAVVPTANQKNVRVYGQEFVRPDDFLNDTANWKVVYDSRKA